jgi:hypothetical protein
MRPIIAAMPSFISRLFRALVRVALSTVVVTLLVPIVCWFLLTLALQSSKSNIALVIVACVPLYYGAILVHELGHLAAGKAVGFPILRFLVGPVQVLRIGGKFRLLFIKPWGHLPGLVEASPTDDRPLRARLVVFAAAGPTASLFGAALCLALAFAVNEAIVSERPYYRWLFWQRLLLPRNAAAGWFTLAAILNLTVFLGTLFPAHERSFLSDGAQLLDLLWGGHVILSRALLGILGSELRKGIRPRAWDPARVERLLALRTGSADDSKVNLFGYYYHLDFGRTEEAGELLDLSLAQRSGYPGSRKWIYAEVSYFEGYHRRNGKTARHWFHRIENGGLEAHTQLRAEAATLLAEGRYQEAVTKAEAGLAVLHRSADPGGAQAEGDWLREILHEAKNGIGK